MLHILMTISLACFGGGCVGRGDIARDFEHEDPQVRIDAIGRAGSGKIRSATPYLVDRLTDSEAEVRMFAITALKEITGLTHGYRHFDSAETRMQSVAKWRKWLIDNKMKSESTQPVPERKTG